jgi:Ca2+-binding EF-hand superfamily protein
MGATLNLVKLNANEDNDIEKRCKELQEKEKNKFGVIDSFFYKFDINVDNYLEIQEFEDAIKSYIDLHPEKRLNMLELLNDLAIDTGDKISIDDFRRIMIAYLSDDIALENIIDVYKCFDKSLNGRISPQELKHVFSKLGLNLYNEEANDLAKEADSNKDLSIDFEEFLKIMITK